MCLILDANLVGYFIKKREITQPIWTWLSRRNGRIVYADSAVFKKELRPNTPFWRNLMLANKIKKVSADEIKKSENELTKILEDKSPLISNDRHIIVAALAGKAKLLASHDKNLAVDFKKLIDNGKIYKHKKHAHLLEKYKCP